MNDWPQVVAVGHNCMDHLCTVEEYPPEDGSTHITAMVSAGGGAAATAAVAAARLGTSAAVVGMLGGDELGAAIRALLEREGVDTRFLRAVSGGRSSDSYIMVDPRRGTRTKFPFPDDLPPIPWDEAQTAAVEHARVLHLDGTRYDNALAAAAIAKRAGVPVSLDGCHMQKDNGKNRALASMCHILIMNSRYPAMVSGIDDCEEALLEMSAWGPKVVVCTQGERGCLAVLEGQVRRFPAYPVQVTDSTGAGDVFHGAFLAAWLRGMDTARCIRFASAAAALKCEKMGGRAGIPTPEAALALMERYGERV